MFGAVEAGGTKFVCAIGTGPSDIDAQTRIETAAPESTLSAAIDFFAGSTFPVRAIGIASFGPLELRRDHTEYGYITSTPKPGWSGTDVVGTIGGALGVPVGFDTDVNGAALGEARWGAGRDCDSFVYLTVGTGIGGGFYVNGDVTRGLVHPEMGHLAVGRRPGDDFPGICPFHGDCLEGMASGPSMEARWGTRAEDLEPGLRDEAVAIEAFYLAQGMRNIVYGLSPTRIIVGGGVGGMPGLMAAVRVQTLEALSGYPGLPDHAGDDFIVAPGLGSQSGIAGAFVLAERAATA